MPPVLIQYSSRIVWLPDEAYGMKDKTIVGRVLPWVHISISNAKHSILDTYHDVKADFRQLYPNEFCYKLNRRYFG